MTWRIALASGGVLLALLLLSLAPAGAQLDVGEPPLHSGDSPMKGAMMLLREGKTDAARTELNRLLQQDPGNGEIYYQLARSWLMDFYAHPDFSRGRTALNLAMEALANVLKRNPDHIPALKAKAVIHARAELLYYDPNLAFELAARVAKLQPSASEYLLNLTDWMSGEVRFTSHSSHRVPHDPLTGLDRSIEILDKVIDASMPYSNEEGLALVQMGKTLAKRRNFDDAIRYLNLALSRSAIAQLRPEILREMGAAYYRKNDWANAARTFYRAMQASPNQTDAYLLMVSLEQWKSGDIQLPASMRFPIAEPVIDPAHPPLIEFTDIAKQMGVNRFDGNGTCAFGDYDGDGKLDLFLAGSGTFLALYRNEGSRFREVTEEAGLKGVPSGYSLNFVDYDNDGKLDLYLTLNGWNGPMANRLYRNLGNGKFEDVSAASGAADGGSGFVSLWGDLDNDGRIDLAIANGVLKDGSLPQLYRNKGDGTFENMTLKAGLKEPPTFGAIGIALGDYDRDGDLDLFISGLQNSPNRLYRNDGNWKFTEVSRDAGLARQPFHNGFVSFFTDYNNDGWPDLLVTSLAPWDAVIQGLSKFFKLADPASLHPDATRLFRNDRNGKFTDVTFEAGLGRPMGVMGAGVADLDNDGYVDFWFGTGDPQLSRIEPSRFFRNRGDGTFEDLTRFAGIMLPGKKGHGVCFTDIDNDGDLDVYAQVGGHYPGDHAENAFFRNDKGNRNHWLQLELTGVKSNRFAIGTQVVVRLAGGRQIYQEVKGSEGFGSTNPYRLHFGLGADTQAESIEILWPGGTKQKLTSIKANQLLKVTEGADPR